MSAPPGWHPQPDGRERWWDGQQWTEHVRDPAPSPQQGGPAGPVQGGSGGYGSVPGGYGPGQGGYGPPPGGQYPPQRTGMSSGAKGCLIAAVVLVLLVVLGLVAAVFVFGSHVKNAVEDVQQSVEAQAPNGTGDVVVIQLGQGFDVGGASVQDGWDVEKGDGFGQRVDGMRASFDGDRTTPVLFTMRFTGQDGTDTETVCTAVPRDGGGGTTEVSCVPLFTDIDRNADVEVTPTL